MMAKKSVKSVDDYLASQPKAVRTVLDRVRTTIRRAVPRAEEGISYQIPTYKLQGRPVLYFAAWKHHYSLYPAGANVFSAFKDDLAPYEVARGTIRFPLSQPVPVKLIAGIAKLRAKQIAAGATSKSRVRKQRRVR
jgi:uncharacterized protein YdhG (YjbR/CyaY superfamily)